MSVHQLRSAKPLRDRLDTILSGIRDYDKEIKIAEGLHKAILGEAIAQGFSDSPLARLAESHVQRMRANRLRLVGYDCCHDDEEAAS